MIEIPAGQYHIRGPLDPTQMCESIAREGLPLRDSRERLYGRQLRILGAFPLEDRHFLFLPYELHFTVDEFWIDGAAILAVEMERQMTTRGEVTIDQPASITAPIQPADSGWDLSRLEVLPRRASR